MEQIMTAIGATVMLVILVIVLGLIMAWPTMLLWNGCLVGAIAGANEIGWLQAFGINVLFGILFRTTTTTK